MEDNIKEKNNINQLSLYNIINDLDLKSLSETSSREQLYTIIKPISSYIKGEVSKMAKSELINLAKGLKFYLKSQSTTSNSVWNFISGSITLDQEQSKIVYSEINQHQRIIAGAGSGKTTTILCRVKYLLDNHMCPDRVLILTFNRDSAQNIRNRINDLFGFPVNLHIYTIDAFCCKLMYMYGNQHVNQHTNKNKYTNKCKSKNAQTDTNLKSLSEYSLIGLELMKQYGKEISNQFVHVFFDEFQDVNDIQFNFLKIFTMWGSWLCVIGDDCQNIYQFRGTNNYYMVNYNTLVPNSHTYKLTSNYRSSDLIVNMANDSISWNTNRVEKQMKVGIKNELGKLHYQSESPSKPTLVVCGTETDKYEYVIKKIKKLIEVGYNYGDIAILSRNTFPLKQMETELTKHSIPHVALITDKNSDDNKRLLEPNKLALTTIHKSKGLEYAIVIIIGLANAHFPEHMNNNIKNIEEERRLFYVGITRCKTHLFLCSSISEIPLSVFIKEVQSHITITYYHTTKKYSRKELFGTSDTESTLKLVYGTNELISTLQPYDYLNLRKFNLIITSSPIVQTIFETKLIWNDDIKKGAFEPDFGEYVDRYITRGICCKLNLDFIDTDTEFIINQDANSKDFELVCELTCESTSKSTSKINNMMKKMLEQNQIRKFTFPSNVIAKIKQSYEKLQNNNNQNKDVEDELYWISLCRNFRLDRTRLAYRNISEYFKKNIHIEYLKNKTDDVITPDTIKSRMEFYINKYGTNKPYLPKCKIYLEHRFKNIYGNKCFLLGELDILVPNISISDSDSDLNTWTLIDFKCSESDFRLEWQLQLMTYYSLIKYNGIESNLNITKIGIINIMDGREYFFDIPSDYDYIKLIEYWEEKICLDQQSIRPKPNLDLGIGTDILDDVNFTHTNANANTNASANEPIIYSPNKSVKKNLAMVLDTETTDFNGDIIQLAYVMVDLDNLSDESNQIIKSFNKLVKNRIPTTRSTKIHSITIDKIRNDGIEFYDIIKEFVEDLEKVTTIIGHNINFDLRLLINNLRKFQIKILTNSTEQINPSKLFNKHEIVCTSKMSGGKSLEKLHMELEGKSIVGAHDAYTDVIATLKCYIKLLNKSNTLLVLDYLV